MLEEFLYKLPFDKDKKVIDFMGVTPEQILYMRKHMTTALPPNMYKRLLSRVKHDDVGDDEEDECPEGRILHYEGFKIKNYFPHNIALMKDGKFVFCKRFDIPLGHTTPIIHGHEFTLVSELFNKNKYI
jgi:hypothetical protein